MLTTPNREQRAPDRPHNTFYDVSVGEKAAFYDEASTAPHIPVDATYSLASPSKAERRHTVYERSAPGQESPYTLGSAETRASTATYDTGSSQASSSLALYDCTSPPMLDAGEAGVYDNTEDDDSFYDRAAKPLRRQETKYERATRSGDSVYDTAAAHVNGAGRSGNTLYDTASGSLSADHVGVGAEGIPAYEVATRTANVATLREEGAVYDVATAAGSGPIYDIGGESRTLVLSNGGAASDEPVLPGSLDATA
jgi:hypothetical protein